MKYTDNLNLRKPDRTDYVDIMDINYNMDIIDQEVSALEALFADSRVEYGSNENGEYWRWENGLQVATGRKTYKNINITLAEGSVFRNRLTPLPPRPAVFTSVFEIHFVIPNRGSTDNTLIGLSMQTRSQILDIYSARSQTDLEFIVGFIAIGRWK